MMQCDKIASSILPAYSGDKLKLYRGETLIDGSKIRLGYAGQAQLIKRVCLGKV